ncbi:acyloxyacyl hydrolase [uncultured Microscilla sp.]|uniref:acyloxyacyl hydrolase n=1 Tax=uncultured Microscilla sp. TaxID=432653 RepID=UPI002601CAF5|nr:acyloxyacyl hydrolase [uncultured Microscilla sp.]
MTNKTLYFICLLFGQMANLHAQTNRQLLSYDMYLHKASVIRGGQHLGRGNPYAFEFRVLQQTDGRKWWHKPFNYPRVGLSFNYLDFDDPMLGKAYSVQLTAEKRLLTFGKNRRDPASPPRLTLNFIAGMGVGYVTNPFDRLHNPKNIMIGSHLNTSWIGHLSLSYAITRQFRLQAQTGIIHFSNAAFTLPNQGVNLSSVNIGLSYQPTITLKPDSLASRATAPKRSAYGLLRFSLGVTEKYPTGGKKYGIMALHAHLLKMWGKVSFWQVGVEGFHNPRLVELAQADEHPHNKRFALTAGVGWIAGRLLGDVGIGYYFYKPQRMDTRVYERYGLRYFLHKKMFIAFHVKSQRGSVDNLEFGIGGRFGN